MGGASSYLAILAICGFLSAAWLATRVSRLMGVSSIVLEIATGVILGPNLLGLLSEEYATCETKLFTNCDLPSNFDALVKSGKSLGHDLDHISEEYCSYWEHEAGNGHSTTQAPTTTPVVTTTPGGGHGGGTGNESNNTTTTTTTTTTMTTTLLKDNDTNKNDTHTNDTSTGGNNQTKPTPKPTPKPGTTTTTPRPKSPTGWDDDADTVPDTGGQDDTDGGVRRLVLTEGSTRRLSGGGSGMEYKSYGECVQKSCEAHVAHECGLTPDVFTLIGHTGVALMIFESGMHFDFEKARVVGPKACIVAVVGTILPLVTGTLLMILYGYPMLPDGLSVGTALAPTSVGIALRLLGEAGVLQHDFGQAIITAAFVDDILSLILFNVLFSLRGSFDIMATVVNPIIGIVFMGVAMLLAVKFWPRAINDYILPRLPKSKSDNPKVSSEDEGLFALMMGLLVAYASITHFLGTHLWGCFIAGMSFACIDREGHKGHTHHVWVRQTKRITSWMIRIFFACTVAFSIPISKLLSFEAFLKGSVMGIGPCILTKVLCAPFMGSARWVIGWAMVGRAEFAYLIAQMAAASNMIDEATFSICIWALLYATIFAPFVFRTVLNRYISAQGIEQGPAIDVDAEYTDDELLDDQPGGTRSYLGHRSVSNLHQDGGQGVFENPDTREAHADSGRPSQAAGKRKVDYGGAGAGVVPSAAEVLDNTSFGRQLEDMSKVELEEGQDKDRRYGMPGHGNAFGTPAVPRQTWWGGRDQPGGSAVSTSPNGFLCCLFFRRVIIT